MRRFIKFFLSLTLLAFVVLGIKIYLNLKDPTPGYKADITIKGNTPGHLSAGFAAVAMTPEVPDTWEDLNGDAAFNPDDGDTFKDGNGNGRFDPVWIAGFGNSRAANGVHDDLWARTMVIDDGKTRIAIVALDLIGFMNDDVVDVRNRIPEDSGIDYMIITSTHSHEGPDMLGLWGESYLRSGVNDEILEKVKSAIVTSVVTAVGKLRLARFEISEDLTGAGVMVKDTRLPEIFDSGLRLIKTVDIENGETLGSLIAWGNHPETLWGKNLMITSDFPHYVRKYTEDGIFKNDSLIKKGTGGIALFVNGAIGGLMTTHPSLAVKDPVSGEEFSKASFEKADAQGKQVAMLSLTAMDNPAAVFDSASIELVARTITLPIRNKFFRLGTMFGILDRGTVGWMKMRSELAVMNIGPLSFATLPGEVYPELINGGIDAPEGRDFDDAAADLLPVRDMMNGKYKFVLGLGNDEIGYILPKSQWDEKPPFTYNNEDAPYGEENSLGPETAELIHRNLKEMLEEINK